jgi:hypothetical protein
MNQLTESNEMNTTGRDYKREQATESPARKAGRAARNRARRAVFNRLAEKYGKTKAKQMMQGKDVDHIKPVAQGGSNAASNLRLRDRKENQSDKGTIFKGKKTTRPKNPEKD